MNAPLSGCRQCESDRVHLENGFTDRLIDQLRGILKRLPQHRQATSGPVKVELPFLQLALVRLWDRLDKPGTGSRTMTPAMLAADDGVLGVLRNHVNRKLDNDLNEQERRLASQIFHYLVTPSGSKFAYSPQDLAKQASEYAASIDVEDVAELLHKLAAGDARILRQAGERFELFHDVLAGPILEWRADFRKQSYLDDPPFACLVDIFTGESMSLGGAGILFGRYPKENRSTTPLAFTEVSRTHLLIMRDGLILDMRSRFGTTVNATPVHFGNAETYLRNGDIIGLANTAVMIYLTGAGPEAEQRERMLEFHQMLRHGWGLLIDGSNRSITSLVWPTIDLGLGKNWIVAGPRDEVEQPFARLTIEQNTVWLSALSEAPPLMVIERADSFRDRPLRLAANKRFEVALKDIPPPKPPTTMSHLEGAHRAVFRYSDIPFEIILNHLPV
jgi:hypothetical protein